MNSKISIKQNKKKTKLNSPFFTSIDKQGIKVNAMKHNGFSLTTQNSRSNSKGKISINNINVNAKNLNLNTNNLNLSLLKKINANSPKHTHQNFTKKIITNLRSQFNEITHNASYFKNEKINDNTMKNSNINTNLSFNFVKSKSKGKDIKAHTNLNSNEKRKNNFLHTDCDFYETEGVSLESLDLEDNQQQLILKEHFKKAKKNYKTKYKDLKEKYERELSEKKVLNTNITNLKKTIYILKNVISIQKEKVDAFATKIVTQKQKEINDIKHSYEDKLQYLLDENNKLKKLFIDAKFAINVSDIKQTTINNKLSSTLSQLITENKYLRSIISTDTVSNIQMKKLFTKVNHQRNETKIELNESLSGLNRSFCTQHEDEVNYSHTQPSLNYTGTFGNSNLYLKRTMKKEVLSNLNIFPIEHYNDKSSLNEVHHFDIKSKPKKCQLRINYINKKK